MRRSAWLTSVLALCVLMLASTACADIALGTIVAIAGQRVTIVDGNGNRITFTIGTDYSLKTGDQIRIEFSRVGDALLATSVQLIQR